MEHNNTPVIVVTEEKKRRKGLLLAAGITAGALALVGGGTFALWQANANFDGGTITAGDLGLGDVTVERYDVSDDRNDFEIAPIHGTSLEGHAIDSDWRMVPGDTVAFVAELDGLTLVGENLIAELGVNSGLLTAVGSLADYVTLEASAYLMDDSGNVTEIASGATAADFSILLSSDTGGALAANDAIGDVRLVGPSDTVTIVVTANFTTPGTPWDTDIQRGVTNSFTFDGGAIDLVQVRQHGRFN